MREWETEGGKRRRIDGSSYLGKNKRGKEIEMTGYGGRG